MVHKGEIFGIVPIQEDHFAEHFFHTDMNLLRFNGSSCVVWTGAEVDGAAEGPADDPDDGRLRITKQSSTPGSRIRKAHRNGRLRLVGSRLCGNGWTGQDSSGHDYGLFALKAEQCCWAIWKF